MNQWGLTGLLPFYAMKMPVYPLLSGNLLLFGVMTTLNVLFLARKKWIKIAIFVICGVYLIIVTIFRSLRLNSSTVFTDLLVDESTTLFVGESQSYLFGVHYVILLSIAFMSISMTSQRIGEEEKVYNKVVKTQIDRLYQCMAQEKKPYVVSKVIGALPGTIANQSQSLNKNQQQELGYVVTYISEGFAHLLMQEPGCVVEDLMFRKVEKINVYDEFESSGDESSQLTRQKSVLSVSVANRYVNCWIGN